MKKKRLLAFLLSGTLLLQSGLALASEIEIGDESSAEEVILIEDETDIVVDDASEPEEEEIIIGEEGKEAATVDAGGDETFAIEGIDVVISDETSVEEVGLTEDETDIVADDASEPEEEEINIGEEGEEAATVDAGGDETSAIEEIDVVISDETSVEEVSLTEDETDIVIDDASVSEEEGINIGEDLEEETIVDADGDEISAIEGIDVSAGESAAQTVAVASGTCGRNLTWTLDSDYTLTISGTGAMTNWYSGNALSRPWNSYRESIRKVVIEEGVTTIGSYALYRFEAATSITIPDTVTSIGKSGVFLWDALQSLTIPDSVTTIGDNAFAGAHSLKKVVIGSGVTVISSGAFGSCTSLTSVTIGRGVTSIGSYAFKNCTSLQRIVIPDNVTEIGTEAFRSCTGLQSIAIPDSVTKIGTEAFQSCTGLRSVTFGHAAASIGHDAFQGCTSLTSVTIPYSITDLGLAFEDCDNLTDIYYDGSIGKWADIHGKAANAAPWCSGAKVHFTNLDIVAVAYGADGERAWALTDDGTLVLAAGTGKKKSSWTVKEVAWNSQRDSIKKVAVLSGVTALHPFDFCGCTNLTSASIASSVIEINSDVFSGCTALTSVTLPKGITTIGGYAFSNCTKLTGITIPASVTKIGAGAFSGCTAMSAIRVSAGNTAYCTLDGVLFTLDRKELVNYPAGASAQSYTVPDTVAVIGKYAFEECGNLKKVILPEKVTALNTGAFYNCTGLTSIVIPTSMTTIENYAFNGCAKLADVYYPGSPAQWGAITIGTSGNTSLTNASINYYSNVNEDGTSSSGTVAANTSVKVIWRNGIPYDSDGRRIVTVGSTISLSAWITGSMVSSSKWSSSSTSVATIASQDENYCTVKGVRAGTCTISYAGNSYDTSYHLNGALYNDSANVAKLRVIQPATALSLNTTALSMKVGNTASLAFTLTPNDDYTRALESVVYIVSDAKVVTVKNDGTVTAIAPGTATITVSNVSGGLEAVCQVTVEKPTVKLSDCTVSLSATSYTYDGTAKKPTVTIKNGSATLKSGTDYTVSYSSNTNAGTAKVTITGKGNYTGTLSKTFTIKKKAVSGLTATLSKTSYIYSGSACKPTVTVKNGSTKLKNGTSYTVKYTNNKNAGKATVTITGKGNYTGTLSKTFTIKKKAVSGLTAALSKTSYVYSGSARKPTVTVKNGSTKLKSGTSYTVKYTNNKSVGKATVTITGKGNYTGTKKLTFKITPKATTLKSVTATSKGFTAKWTKQTMQTTGYQLQYATDSKYTSGVKTVTITKNKTTSKKITKLKAKEKYYVRIRTYKTVSGTKYVSAWSKAKTVTTKK